MAWETTVKKTEYETQIELITDGSCRTVIMGVAEQLFNENDSNMSITFHASTMWLVQNDGISLYTNEAYLNHVFSFVGMNKQPLFEEHQV